MTRVLAVQTLPDPVLHWTEQGQDFQARWRSERGAAPPARVFVADDTLPADRAYRLACEGTALLWHGDFQNARHLLQALIRRVDRPARRKRRPAAQVESPAQRFHLHRMARAQRSRVLASVLVPVEADYGVALRRAPDWRQACIWAWGDGAPDQGRSVVSLRELLGVASAAEWRRTGVEIAALGAPPGNRIHPHYGVFSPVRGEYLDLVAKAPLPAAASTLTAFDIGTGTGVLAALLARRGVAKVVATDLDPRALACARDNVERLGVQDRVSLLDVDLFPEGRADLVVCNPPWLPARPSAPVEAALYDEDGRMLRGFVQGLADHLAPAGEGWLILSDLAEHLGLRTRAELLALFEDAGLQVLDRLDVRPRHPKALDPDDALHQARAAEVTSLWRLAARPSDVGAGPTPSA